MQSELETVRSRAHKTGCQTACQADINRVREQQEEKEREKDKDKEKERGACQLSEAVCCDTKPAAAKTTNCKCLAADKLI